MTSGFQVSGSAPDHYERFNPPMMAPFIDVLIQAVALTPGDAVLDVACGTGLASRVAAAVVGPSGRVDGLDLNSAMLDKARSVIAPPDCAPLQWYLGSALELPFEDGSYRAVISQQGLQFFPDLYGAVREMARVTVPAGRVAATFWSALEEQSYMRAQVEAAREFVGDAANPIAAGFTLDGARAAEAFAAAGLRDIEARRVTATIALPDIEMYARGQLSATPTGPALQALPADSQDAYAHRVIEELASYRGTDGVVRCPFVSWLVSGAR